MYPFHSSSVPSKQTEGIQEGVHSTVNNKRLPSARVAKTDNTSNDILDLGGDSLEEQFIS